MRACDGNRTKRIAQTLVLLLEADLKLRVRLRKVSKRCPTAWLRAVKAINTYARSAQTGKRQEKETTNVLYAA